MREKMEWSLVLLVLTGHCSFLMAQLYDYTYIKQNLNWSEAQTYCREKHTDLATVYDMRDMKRLCGNETLCEEGWIGLHNTSITNKTWHWSLPGVEFKENEANWGEDEPDNIVNGEEENVVGINNDLEWFDILHSVKRSFICYDEKPQPKYTEIEQQMTWLEAQKYCREKHTDLISGPDQLGEVRSIIEGKEKTWAIGLFRDRWEWSDGNGSSFRNWEELPLMSNRCAATTENQRWKGEPCQNKKHFYCYDANVILIPLNKTWTEAIYYCREHHHDLVYIRNEHQQRWMGQVARKANSPYVWMGLHFTCTLQFWFWVTDKAVHYDNWASDISENHCDMSGAMERGGTNKWYKMPDENKYNFICSDR